VEVLRRHSNNYGAVQRVGRLTRHLAEHLPVEASAATQPGYRPNKLSQRLSNETVALILVAYAAGATTREVGQRFGLAHSSVNKLLKQHGVAARQRSLSHDEVQRAVELYEAGQSTRIIAEHLGFGASTVTRVLYAAGVTLRPAVHTHESHN
jgi:DNA-binding transcriptional regulator LsrR (DeoR family)